MRMGQIGMDMMRRRSFRHAAQNRFTACLITKDEEFHLPAALASVAFADEIIVVDSHSKDRTRDIENEKEQDRPKRDERQLN